MLAIEAMEDHHEGLAFFLGVFLQYFVVLEDLLAVSGLLDFFGNSGFLEESTEVVVDFLGMRGGEVTIDFPDVVVGVVGAGEAHEEVLLGSIAVYADIGAQADKPIQLWVGVGEGLFVIEVLLDEFDVLVVVFVGVVLEEGNGVFVPLLVLLLLALGLHLGAEGEVVAGVFVAAVLLLAHFLQHGYFLSVVVLALASPHQLIICRIFIKPMKENEKAIEAMLQEEGHDATQGAKQAIADFTVLYARKLIRKSLFPNKTTITLDDVRYIPSHSATPTRS